MSFLSVLKSIGGVFGKVTSVVTPLEPVIGAVPVYGAAFNSIFNTVVGVEGLFSGLITSGTAPTAQTGALKKSIVTSVVNSTVAPPPGQVAAPISPATLSTTIDQIVAALNQLQAAQAALTAGPAIATGATA